ncbi:MAG: F0F1 ATP synthase subunit gamma [Candidatus Omnitrophica bacterium]|nr:F0F1 ATP synthase subunit gamma [Candidatus Omnitrophota bacterium]
MQTVQKLKKEFELNTELAGLLDTLKGIASAQFRMLEKKKERFKHFLFAFEKFFPMIDFNAVQHPFARDKGPLGIMIVTSDEGFMGGLNTRVINTALSYPGADDALLIVIGARGASYLKGLGHDFLEFPGIASDRRYEEAVKFKNFIIKKGLAGTFARLILVYPKPLSFTVQKPQVLSILPCSELFQKKENLTKEEKDIITEGSPEGIIEYLLDAWITEKLFEVFEDSHLSEFSARTVHLEESHQILLRRSRVIRGQYLRSYHELVDKGMREAFASRIIHRKKQNAN